MKTKEIKALVGFYSVSDGDLLHRGVNIQTNLTGNSHFPNPPVDLAVLEAALERFAALIAQALDGSKQVIAQRNQQRMTVIHMLRLLARYVEMASNGDFAVFQTSGFEAAAMTRVTTPPLSEKIRKLERGNNSGEIVAWLQRMRGASSYEFRWGQAAAGAVPAAWTTVPLTRVKQAVTVTGLTAGATYMFQARALAQNKFTDWSDPVTFVCG
jgi:hypothetical protein